MIEIQLSTLFLFYGLCFGFQNKLPFLHDKADFLDKLLHCSYCTGFHCGWISWVLLYLSKGCPEIGLMEVVSSVVIFGFVSSAFCYALDSLVQLIESHTLSEE